MGENFTTGRTRIEDLLSKQDQILERAASIVYDAVMDRMQRGKISESTRTDIDNLLTGFIPEQKTIILEKAMILLLSNMRGSTTNSRSTEERINRGSLFGSSRTRG